MFLKRKTDKFVVLLLGIGLFCFFSYRPKFRISTQMPLEFLDTPQVKTKVQRAAEEKLANAYWACVVNTIQWKYTYGNRLPPVPPPEFTIAGGDPAITSDDSTRARYWQKVQQVWNIPSIWNKQYEWDTGWTVAWTDDAKAVGNWFYARLPR